jgi:hypothetical protein
MQSGHCLRPASTYSDPRAVIVFCGSGVLRVTVPFHSAAILHPKIIKQVIETI